MKSCEAMFCSGEIHIKPLFAFEKVCNDARYTCYFGRASNGIIFYLDGGHEFAYGTQKLVTKQGDLVFLPKGLKYSNRIIPGSDGATCRYYQINFQSLCKGFDVPCFAEPVAVETGDNPALKKLCAQVVAKMHSKDPYRQLEMSIGIASIIYRILCRDRTDETVSLAVRCRNAFRNMYTLNTDISEIAKAAYVSMSTFERWCKGEHGVSPAQYRNAVRVERSKEFLMDNTLSVGEIAGLVGYSDIYYFSRVFKKVTGNSPEEWRNGRLGNKDGI